MAEIVTGDGLTPGCMSSWVIIWTRFDDTLDPCAPEQIAQERDRYRRAPNRP
ncbi:hypothetical protein HFO97_01840 [Rhizobium leguminosarum]|uniref:hypothetical protein n=1 Tax=Rhizobium leguminosarum TaxID=384 RepID=UPI001C93FDAF|nr:hypothetical protein [Rhizobium leguminosarum]MBY5358746.1 hypothetical protein [Rhizobium leguminosarum]